MLLGIAFVHFQIGPVDLVLCLSCSSINSHVAMAAALWDMLTIRQRFTFSGEAGRQFEQVSEFGQGVGRI